MGITIRRMKKRKQDRRRKLKEQDKGRKLKEGKNSIDEKTSMICTKTDHNPPCVPGNVVLYDILSRLPVKSLIRFRCVSKLWYNTIDHDPYFNSIQLIQSRKNPILLINFFNIKSMDYHYFYLKKKEDALVISMEDKYGGVSHHAPNCGSYTAPIGCSNGLVCLCVVSDNSCFIRILNPSRHPVLNTIPIMDVDFQSIKGYGFGYDSLTKEYKVVCIIVKQESWEESWCLVYTLLGNNNSWRHIRGPGTCELQSGICTKPAISCDGALYWRIANDALKMLSFDLHNEKFQFIEIPEEAMMIPLDLYDDEKVQFIEIPIEGLTLHPRIRRLVWFHYLEYQGYLCFATLEEFDGQHCKLELFKLKDRINQRWVMETRFVPFTCDHATRIMCFYDQVLLYWLCGGYFLFYDVDTEVANLVKFPISRRKHLDVQRSGDADYQLYSYIANSLCLKN